MLRMTRPSAARSSLGVWTIALVLVHVLLPALHVHDCNDEAHAAPDSAGLAFLPDAPHGVPPAAEDYSAHECDVCRTLSHSGALIVDAVAPILLATDLPVLPVASVHAIAWQPIGDDLGRAPPARTA